MGSKWVLFAGLSLMLMCRPVVHSNFGVEQWSSYDFQHKPVVFKALNARALLLNFYSPICQPCIAELPALHYFYEQSQQKDIPMFLVVAPQLSSHGLEASSKNISFQEQEARQILIQRLKEDILRYGIRIPMLIMRKEFQIGPTEIVQATPETLFFRQSPLRLEYNFIGPLAQGKEKAEFLKNSRFQYALKKLDEL